MLIPAKDDTRQVDVPASVASEKARRRPLVLFALKLATLRHLGFPAEARMTDDRGAPLDDDQARALREAVECAARGLALGRAAGVRRTLAEIEATTLSDREQVDALLGSVYQAHAKGEPSDDVLDVFLDTFEGWQNREGAARIDLLFDRLDFDSAPEPLGILLLATTRLTRGSFARRDAFITRLRTWLVGRDGRTEAHVDSMLRGLRE